MIERTIRVGHSPDPDDAFMFYGLASGKVKLPGIRIEHMLEDIQSLNERAIRAELEVTAISAHAFSAVADRYWIMRTGASMGEGYGPVVISRRFRSLDELKGKTVGTPGPLTTATLLFKTFTEGIRNVDMPFDAIMAAVDNGDVDAGLLIHEGQITYGALGYHKVIDFGEFWQKETQGSRSRSGSTSCGRTWGRRWPECFPGGSGRASPTGTTTRTNRSPMLCSGAGASTGRSGRSS